MAWLLFNLLTTILSSCAVLIFFLATKKLSASMALARLLVPEIKKATDHLQHSLQMLQHERERFFLQDHTKPSGLLDEQREDRQVLEQYLKEIYDVEKRLTIYLKEADALGLRIKEEKEKSRPSWRAAPNTRPCLNKSPTHAYEKSQGKTVVSRFVHHSISKAELVKRQVIS